VWAAGPPGEPVPELAPAVRAGLRAGPRGYRFDKTIVCRRVLENYCPGRISVRGHPHDGGTSTQRPEKCSRDTGARSFFGRSLCRCGG